MNKSKSTPFFTLSSLLLFISFNLCSIQSHSQKINVPLIFQDAETQTKLLLAEIPKAVNKESTDTLVSPRTVENGVLILNPSRKWISGFFPGMLWYLYEYTGKKEWRKQAEQFTANIEQEKTNNRTHDIGFKVYCSFGNGYRLTKDKNYKAVILQSAKTLASRFSPITGTIRSWDTMRRWANPVIIDNMMNLELLFEATKISGDSSFYKIAVSHANTTLKHHFRSDYSCYHVVDYDSTNGNVIKRNTHQGYADESAWARGQAWALYGYTMCYRATKDKKYLTQAENVAGFIFNNRNMPKDLIPYWDFNAPKIPDEPRDASAAACIASALYELAHYSNKGNYYYKLADTIIENLTKYYRSPIGATKGFILLHSTGSKPANSEVDVPLTYADYYYLEALLRRKKNN